MNGRDEIVQALMARPPRPPFSLGGFGSFSDRYPPSTVNAKNPLPSYSRLGKPMPPDMAPTQIVKGIARGVSNLAMQANEAMPWGGNNPQAIGIDPQAGTIDPSKMIPFATDVAGMATTGSLAAPAVGNGLGMGIRAYHGSPHDFDRFSMDKIGTGEGAQAYGHGLYFAENPAVAGDYRKALTDNRGGGGGPKMVTSYDVNGRHIPQSSPDWAVADVANTMREHGINPASPDGSAWLDDELGARYMSGAVKDTDAARAKVLDFYKAGEFKQDRAAGRMYEVDINASPDEFLDWDKPLSEQPESVQAAIGVTPEIRKALADHLQSGRKKTDYDPETWRLMRLADDNPMGSTLAGNKPETAEALRAAGIKGIRYKDAGSRGTDAAGGTSNFVVFDDNIIDILKKYGIAGLVPAGGAGAAMLGGTQDASAASTGYTTLGRF